MQTQDESLLHLAQVLQQAQQMVGTATRELTLFDTAMCKLYENPNTELWAFFLNNDNAHGLEGVFYQGLLAAVAAQHDALMEPVARMGELIQVSTEIHTSQGSRIDLLLEADNGLMLIECKIGHHQNNPFTDYEAHVERLLQNKPTSECVKLIVCVDGKSHITGWQGLSYHQLARHTKPFLAEALLAQPYNKWALFARDFLIHWEQLGVEVMNQQQMDFVLEHLSEIKQLEQLRNKFYQHVIDHILLDLENQIEGYARYHRIHTWSGTPALRFAHNLWTKWSDVVVNLRIDEQPLKSNLRIYIEEPNDELIDLVCTELEHTDLKFSKGIDDWFESKNHYWGCNWEIDFDLEVISAYVIQLMQVLMKVEASR